MFTYPLNQCQAQEDLAPGSFLNQLSFSSSTGDDLTDLGYHGMSGTTAALLL